MSANPEIPLSTCAVAATQPGGISAGQYTQFPSSAAAIPPTTVIIVS